MISVLDTAKENNVDISFSVTLTEESLKSKEGILDLIKKYNINGFGFNILMNSDGLGLSSDYYERSSKFIIDSFLELRKIGVYEDRVMRKVKAFQKAQVYYSDCSAQSGGAGRVRSGRKHRCMSRLPCRKEILYFKYRR